MEYKRKGKEEGQKCKRWDSNPRVRTHYDLNVAPWTTRTHLLPTKEKIHHISKNG